MQRSKSSIKQLHSASLVLLCNVLCENVRFILKFHVGTAHSYLVHDDSAAGSGDSGVYKKREEKLTQCCRSVADSSATTLEAASAGQRLSRDLETMLLKQCPPKLKLLGVNRWERWAESSLLAGDSRPPLPTRALVTLTALTPRGVCYSSTSRACTCPWRRRRAEVRQPATARGK